MKTNEFNQDVSKWTADSRRKMKRAVIQLTTQYSGAGQKQLKTLNRKYYGETNQIGFVFPLYMVFVHKGAGRGYGGNKTGFFSNRTGGKTATNPISSGRMGTGRRIPKPWFNPVIEANFPVLADLIATYHGGKQIDNIQRLLID
jgi:hypothetical protein